MPPGTSRPTPSPSPPERPRGPLPFSSSPPPGVSDFQGGETTAPPAPSRPASRGRDVRESVPTVAPSRKPLTRSGRAAARPQGGDCAMSLFRWLNRRPTTRPQDRRPRPGYRPWLEALEGRTLPATTITIVPGAAGSGSLDAFLLQSGGTVAAADGGNAPGTLSTGALTSVAAASTIRVTAQAGITFNDLRGSLLLPTRDESGALFTAAAGAITFANPANTLATAGGDLVLS